MTNSQYNEQFCKQFTPAELDVINARIKKPSTFPKALLFYSLYVAVIAIAFFILY